MGTLYKNMVCSVTIGSTRFDAVNNVRIKKSFKELSDKGIITLPREFTHIFNNGGFESMKGRNIRDFIREGDKISISLGYDSRLIDRFKGYVTKIGADVPLVLEIEDEMWKLRKGNFVKTFANATLLELLEYIAPGYNYDVTDNIRLGKFIIKNASAFEALEALRKDYLLHSFFINKNTLHVGFPVDIIPNTTHIAHMNRNVRDASQLVFQRKEENKLQIKAISNNSNGTKTIVQVGESGGSTRTLNYADKTKKELTDLAQKNLDTLNFDGYTGFLKMFGEPAFEPGEAVDIIDPNYRNSERDGVYLIEACEIDFDSSGYEQTVKLSLPIS